MMLSQEDVDKLLDKYDIPTPELLVAKNIKDLEDMDLDYPIVMKLMSPSVVHKSDIAGVIMNIHSLDEARRAFKTFESICDKKDFVFKGAMIQPHQKGHFVIVGLKNDPQFGPVVMFGSGGIFVEIMKDVTFRVCPITLQEAIEMVKEIKGFPILNGARGEKANINAIAHVIKRVSDIGIDEDIEEMDINPLIAWRDGVSAVDVRMKKL